MAKTLNRIKIDKIGYGWVWLARMSDGKRILIKWGALPGSIVDLRIVKQRKDYVEAHITHIQELDPKIVDGKVFCPHFFSLLSSNDENKQPRKVGCGGCKWQMLSYKNQMQLKEDIVNDAFTKIKRKLPDLQVLSIIWSPSEKNYRNKIEFSFGKYITQNKEWGSTSEWKKELSVLSDWSVGFHKQGEFSKIIDIDSCGLISDEANKIFEHIKWLCATSGLPVHDQMTHQGFFRHLVIREGTNTKQFLINLSVSDNDLKENKQQQWQSLLEIFKNDSILKNKVTSFVITYNNSLADVVRSQDCRTETLRWDGIIYEKLIFDKEKKSADDIVSFRVSPFSFFQTNTLWAQQLFSQAMKMVGHVEWTLLDLYCGTGTIGISFLKLGKWDKLVGIEIVEEAIKDVEKSHPDLFEKPNKEKK